MCIRGVPRLLLLPAATPTYPSATLLLCHSGALLFLSTKSTTLVLLILILTLVHYTRYMIIDSLLPFLLLLRTSAAAAASLVMLLLSLLPRLSRPTATLLVALHAERPFITAHSKVHQAHLRLRRPTTPDLRVAHSRQPVEHTCGHVRSSVTLAAAFRYHK